MEINLANTQKSIETQKMTSQIEMKMVDSSMFTHTEQPSMWENQVTQSFHQVLLASQPIDQQQHFTWAQNVENYSLLVRCNSLAMNSLKKRTIKKFKKQFFNGSLKTKVTLKNILINQTSPKQLANIIMYQTSLLLLIDWDHACKSLMNFQKISQLCSMKNFTSLILIWFLKHLSYITLLESSTNHLLWFLLSLRHQCQHFKLLFSHQQWKISLLQLLIYMILMNNLPAKKSSLLNLQINVLMMTSITISKNVVIFLESVHKFKIQMIQKQSFIIYFKKSSSIRAPPSHEAKVTSQMCGQILILQQIELSQTKSTPWIKGQMLCQVWVVLALRTQQWPTLICKVAT